MEDSEFLKTPTGWCVIQQICLRITQPVVNSEVNDKISSQASEVQVRIPKYIVPDIVWSWYHDFDQLVPPYLPWLVLVRMWLVSLGSIQSRNYRLPPYTCLPIPESL